MNASYGKPAPGIGKSVLITGCTPGGIGFALSNEFRRRGFHVIATARREEVVSKLRAVGFSAVQLDVTDETSIAACRKEVHELVQGKLDILVNNAGRGFVMPATDIPLSTAREVFETNVFGTMAMVSSFIDMLIAAKGLIINIASISALYPYIFGSIYASSKAALVSYSRTLRAELGPLGVRVQVAMAGTVRSNLAAANPSQLPPESLYQPFKTHFEARQGYSQKPKQNPIMAETFAVHLVDQTLKSEVTPFWRTWFGRPDWWYYGGMSSLAYWASLLGEWAVDTGAWLFFGVREMHQTARDIAQEQRLAHERIERRDSKASVSWLLET